MFLAVHIKSTDNSRIVVNGTNGTEYIGSSTGHGTGTAKEFHIRSNANGKYICWVGTNGTRYCAKGLDYGSTAQAQGSVWINGTASLRFAHAGRAYRTDLVQVRNSITNTTLYVYSNSTRTTLLATVTAGSTATVGYYKTLYLRSTGLGTRPVSADTSITLAKAGHLYTVTGTYVPGEDAQYSCDCVYDSTSYASTCTEDPERWRCNITDSDGSCTWNGFRCDLQCDFTGDPGSEYMKTKYECETDQVSSSFNGSFSSGPTITMSA
jgi:hypothetical protein